METLEWNQKQKELFNLYFKNHEGITVEEIMNNMRNYSQIWQDFYRFLINSSLEFNMFDSIDEIKKIKYNNINYLIIKIGLFEYLCIDLDKKEAINYNNSLEPFNEEFFIKHFDEHKIEKPEDFYYYLDMHKKDINELIEYIDNNDILLEKKSFIHKIDIYNHTTFLFFNVTKQTVTLYFGNKTMVGNVNYIFLDKDLNPLGASNPTGNMDDLKEMALKVKDIVVPTCIIPEYILSKNKVKEY